MKIEGATKVDMERFYLLSHTHGEAYAAYDVTFNVNFRQTKDAQFASLRALGAYEAVRHDSEAGTAHLESATAVKG